MNTLVRRFVWLSEIERREIRVWVDGCPTKALEGNTLLVAPLSNTGHLRHSEFSDGRAVRLLPDGCVPGLLGARRGRATAERLQHARPRRHAHPHFRTGGRTGQPRIVIVGTGPAGVRAAQVLVEMGMRLVVVDESRRDGGQIYHRQPEGFKRPYTKLCVGRLTKGKLKYAKRFAIRLWT